MFRAAVTLCCDNTFLLGHSGKITAQIVREWESSYVLRPIPGESS